MIELRPLTSDDLAAVCDLQNRAQQFDGLRRILELDELAEELDDERVVHATDVRVAEVDGVLAGYGYTYYLPSEVRQERCYLFGDVDPAHRGRGVGRALLAWSIERGTEQLRASGNDLPKYLRVDSYDHIESAHRLYARAGFTPVRYFEELLRPLDDVGEPLAEAVAPDGVTIVPWDEARDQEIRIVNDAAFADHWGSTPMTADRWDDMVRGYGARLDLSFIALDDATGAVVALCLNKRFESDDELLGRREAWIDHLGTLAPWRKRGVASALIAASLRAFRGAGLSHASIGVDSESPTGAAGLYRSLGFEPQLRSITHEIELA